MLVTTISLITSHYTDTTLHTSTDGNMGRLGSMSRKAGSGYVGR